MPTPSLSVIYSTPFVVLAPLFSIRALFILLFDRKPRPNSIPRRRCGSVSPRDWLAVDVWVLYYFLSVDWLIVSVMVALLTLVCSVVLVIRLVGVLYGGSLLLRADQAERMLQRACGIGWVGLDWNGLG